MQHKEWIALPISIALAGAFIGIGIDSAGKSLAGKSATGAIAALPAANNAPTPSAATKVAPVTAADHIKGNAKAKAIIVEYSDLECPFCKQFHETVKQTVAKFSASEVAWVYRHFPLDALHSKARKEAEASECAAEQGGNDAFWKYIDRVFAITPANNRLELSELPNIAEYIGLNRATFEKCLSSGKFAAKVESQYQSGVAAGVRGTPYSIIITADGNTPLNGAVPATSLESSLKAALGKK